jgi:predicted transcriptional regulator
MNKLKSQTTDDASSSIVVSFDSKWADILTATPVTRVFRKRAPRNFRPTKMYVYIGAPVSSLIGRCEVTRLDWLPIKEALALWSEGAIPQDELRRYAGGYDTMAAYTIDSIEACRRLLSYVELHEQFAFSPPQSFFVLSKAGQAELDELAGFVQKKRKGQN